MAKGNRFSALPISQFCAKSAALNLGSGRAAAISSCFHARCAGDDKWREMYARLTDEEQDEFDKMLRPSPVQVEGAELLYDIAAKEAPLGLDEYCGFVPKGSVEAVTEGTCDMYWIHDHVAYVADIKRSEWTTSDGPNSLQVKGYALAVCAKHHDEVDGYVCGIWAAQEGLWSWGEYTPLDSEQCMRDWERVKAAALNIDGDFSTGRHCRGCYARTRCPAYLVPPEHAQDGLAKYLSGEIDRPRVLELLAFVERVEETCKMARGVIKADVDRNGPIPDGEGKIYGPVNCRGKAKLDKVALETDYPELIQKYTSLGQDYAQYRWTNDPAFDEQRKQDARDKAKAKRIAAAAAEKEQ